MAYILYMLNIFIYLCVLSAKAQYHSHFVEIAINICMGVFLFLLEENLYLSTHNYL